MDYSKYGISRKKQNLRSSAKKGNKKAGYIVFRVFIICFILIAVIGVSAGIGGIKGIIDSAPEIKLSDIAPKGFKSYIYSMDGELQHEIVGTGSNRIYVSIDDINENVQNAFIALEDERFRSHNGIDPQGIIRAFFVGVTSGGFSEGASTITQQLLKLSIFSGGEEPNLLLKFRRKFQEQYLALELEKQLSKDEILEAYLNTINLGQGCYGVEAASNYYFKKSADELSVAEAAVLASIAQSPTRNNPINGPKVNKERSETTVDKMFTQGLIDETAKDSALNELTSIYPTIASNAENYQAEQAEVYTPYEEEAIKQVISDLQTQFGYTYAEAYEKVYSGALKIYLAQDPVIQEVCDSFYRDDSNFPTTEYLLTYDLSIYLNPEDPTDNSTTEYHTEDLLEFTGQKYAFYATPEAADADIAAFKESLGVTEDMKILENKSLSPQVQSSFVVIDHKNGYVSAMVANRGDENKKVNFGLNRATSSPRQPGSVFKIVSTYAPALDAVGDTLATTKIDKNVESYGGHVIENVNKKQSLQNMTFLDAIIQSKNTVAVRALKEDVGTDLAIEYLQDRFHFSTIDEQEDAIDGLAIGGITYGVTNLELTASFAAIANMGQYNRPVFYTKVLDADGNVLLENSADNPKSETAIRPVTAYQLTTAMQGVVTHPLGTATPYVRVNNMPVAGKTGTTDDYKDTWFVGYSPYYTAGIWFGYDNYIDPTSRGMQLYRHEVLWGRIMTAINDAKGLERIDFAKPEGIVETKVCSLTGKLPGAYCQSNDGIFEQGSEPTERCDECRVVYICSVCKGIAGPNTTQSYGYRYTVDNPSGVPGYHCTCQPAPPPETPPAEGGETPPPAEGGGETPPPAEGGGTTPPPAEGGGEAPPA